MTVLVTGAAGQLGQAVVAAARARALPLHAAARAELDITDQARVDALVDELAPRAVVNCAALNDVDGAEGDIRPALAVNAFGPRNLAVACRRADVPLLHVSSDYVFDGEAQRPYSVATRPAPVNRYGESKLHGEQLVGRLCPRHFIVRVSWLFGAGKHCFVGKLLSWASQRQRLRVVDDHVSAPTRATDAAPVLLDLLQGEAYGTYHLTNRGHCSRYDWARCILEAAGLGSRVELERARRADFAGAPRPAYSVLDSYPLGRSMPTWQQATTHRVEGVRSKP